MNTHWNLLGMRARLRMFALLAIEMRALLMTISSQHRCACALSLRQMRRACHECVKYCGNKQAEHAYTHSINISRTSYDTSRAARNKDNLKARRYKTSIAHQHTKPCIHQACALGTFQPESRLRPAQLQEATAAPHMIDKHKRMTAATHVRY